MRLLTLLFVVGVAAASRHSPFQTGTHYTFKYEGRMLSGLPELATHYSGLGIKCIIHLQVVNDNEYRIKITDAKYAKVNQQLQAEGTDLSKNWRMIPLPEYREIPQETARHLGEPTILKLHSGSKKFSSLVVSGDEPMWSVNFKKALAVLFSVKTAEQYSRISENIIEQEDEQQQQSYYSSLPFWKAQEDSLDGVCETTYQLNELPPYMVRENRRSISPFPSACGGAGTKFYEIVRSRDVDSCVLRTGDFGFYKPGTMDCKMQGNCEGQSTRSSITRYFACGSSRDDLHIQSIMNEGEAEMNLMGVRGEKFVTGSKQNLTLIAQSPLSSSSQRIHGPSNPEEKKSLTLEHSKSSSSSLSSLPSILSKMTGKRVPEGIEAIKANYLGKDGHFRPEVLVKDIVDAITDIVENDLISTEGQTEDKEIPMRLLKISRGFSLLGKSNMESVYSQLKSKFSGQTEKEETMKNLFFDTLVMCGTRDAVFMFKDKVTSGEVGDVQASSLLTFLPNYVLSPDPQVLESLYDLMTTLDSKQHQGRRSEMVYHQSLVGLTSLVHKACIAQNRAEAFPFSNYGEFCRPDSDFVLSKLLPFLKQKLESCTRTDQRIFYVATLGVLGHKNVVSLILPSLQGTPSSSSSNDPKSMVSERTTAIYSVALVARAYPMMGVENILFSVLNNQAEPTELRIAAFKSLLDLNPSESYLHRIASLTWREKNEEVLRAVHTALYTLQEIKETQPRGDMSSNNNNNVASLPAKAYLIYPLIKKPTTYGFPSSAVVTGADFLPHLGVGYAEDTTWVSSPESYVPVDFYHRMQYLMDGGRWRYSLFQFGKHFVGGENLVQQIVEMLTPHERHITRQEYAEKIKNHELSRDWKEVIDKLGLKVKESDAAEIGVFASIFETAPVFDFLSSTSPSTIKDKMRKLLKKDLSLQDLCGHKRINVQRITNLESRISAVPSDLGLLFVAETHLPQLLSIRGSMNTDCASAISSYIPKFDITLKKQYEASKVGYVGTIDPFDKEFVTTGIEQSARMNFPIKFNVQADTHDQSVKVRFNTKDSSVSSGTLDLFHYRLRPFTASQSVASVTPVSKCSQFKVIRSPTQRQTKEKRFGDFLGLSFKLGLESESRFVDFRSTFEKMSMFNGNPSNLLRFMWISAAMSEKLEPSARFHQVKLTFEPSESTTREVEYQLKWGSASKLQGEQVKYDRLRFSKEELESYPEWKKLLPIKWESKIIGQSPDHPRRQQKLKEMFEKTRLSSGQAMMVNMKLTLLGNRARHYDWTLKHAQGEEEFLKQRWSMELESSNTDKKLCVDGSLSLPESPMWSLSQMRSSNLRFGYRNVVAFGRQCQESKITIDGEGRVSQKQKEYSQSSPEFRSYQSLLRRNFPLAEMSLLSEEVRAQATNFDEADFTIKYENVPREVVSFTRYGSEYAKSYLWPYLVVNPHNNGGSSSSSNSNNMVHHLRFRYKQVPNTVDVTLSKQDEEIVFKNVRLPGVLSYFLPQNAIRMTERSQNSNSRVYPKCKLEGGWLRSYDNETMPADQLDCLHVLTADCSYRKSFAVMAQNISSSSDSSKELVVFIGKTSIVLTPTSRSSYSTPIKVKVNETEISMPSLPSGGHRTIKGEKKDYVADIYLSKDGVITLNFLHCPIMRGPSVIIKFDGHKTEAKLSPMYRGKLCGLCGGQGGLRLGELVGPRRCAYSKPELLTASYRVSKLSSGKGRTCQPLPSGMESQLRREQSECVKEDAEPTSVIKSFKAQIGPCSRHTHQIIEMADKFCFSRVPVVSCSAACKPSERTRKRVDFVCMPKGRLAERYAEKIRRGEILPEVQRMNKTFNTQLRLPRSCVDV